MWCLSLSDVLYWTLAVLMHHAPVDVDRGHYGEMILLMFTALEQYFQSDAVFLHLVVLHTPPTSCSLSLRRRSHWDVLLLLVTTDLTTYRAVRPDRGRSTSRLLLLARAATLMFHLCPNGSLVLLWQLQKWWQLCTKWNSICILLLLQSLKLESLSFKYRWSTKSLL